MMPENSAIIQAKLTKVGDRIKFLNPRFDYTVEEVDIDSIGNIRHRAHDGTLTSSYQPNELLYIEKGTYPERKL